MAPPKKKARGGKPKPTWEFDNGDKWTTYDDEDCELLEDAFQDDPKAAFVTKDLTFNKGFDTKYKFNFKKMTQTNNSSGTIRKIRRKTASDDSDSDSDSDDDAEYAWEWVDDHGMWIAFYDEDTSLIEKAFKSDPTGTFKTKALSFNKGFDTKYEFNFKKRIQTNLSSDTSRKLRRVPKAGAWKHKGFGISGTKAGSPKSKSVLDYPKYWSKEKKSIDRVDVDLDSKEAKRILNQFHKTLHRKAKVHSLTRIQNYSLWKFYALTRDHIAGTNGDDPNEEDCLFHGCRVRANMDAILEFGFDMRVAASGAYGVGIYFAVNAQYSDGGYVLQNSDKSKEMIICRTTLGSEVDGKHGLRRPPPKVASKPSGALHDSVSNSGKPKIMHIVFNNTQAYPEYVLRYT